MDLKSLDDLKPKKQTQKRKAVKYRIDSYQVEKTPWKPRINSRAIISLLLGLGVLSGILLITMLTAGGTVRTTSKPSTKLSPRIQQAEVTEVPAGEQELGVVTKIDTDKMELTLFDVIHEVSSTYRYTGGTSIKDKYDQQLAISQIPIGTMVEVYHMPEQSKLTEIRISTKAWEYVGVNNFGIDRSARVMKIASNKYKYTDDLLVLDGETFVPVSSIAEQDELTVRGYDQTVWSVTVTRGHGTVRLEDYEDYLGDYITIGYEAIQQIIGDMVITVREGNFNLTVENPKYTATKNITIYRNKETLVSLSGMGPGGDKVGRVTFKIAPFGADLFIDRELMSYANPIELDYGEHNIEVSLEGYTTYIGTLKVDAAGKTIRIDLPEKNSEGKAVVAETDTGDDADTADHSGSADNTDTEGDASNTEEDVEETIDIVGADNISNADKEEDEEHRIFIQNPSGASVYLNGEYMCKSPGSFKKLIGTHVLTFIKEGYETQSYTVEVADDNKDTYLNMPDLKRK